MVFGAVSIVLSRRRLKWTFCLMMFTAGIAGALASMQAYWIALH